MCYAFIYLLSNMDAWLRTGLNKEPSCIHRLVDPSDFFVPHSIQAILLHLHLYWMQNPSRFLLNCAVHDWDLWSLLGQRYKELQIFFPLTLSLSDMSPSRIHLCCCGKEMKKNLSLNPCMHVPFDFIVCISDWWFCFLFTTYSGCHWCRVNCEQTEPMLLFSFHFCSISIDGFWSK